MASTRIVVAALLLATACGDAPSAGGELAGVELAKAELARQSGPSTLDVPALAKGNVAFAFDIFERVAAAHPGENLVVSPYSISSALAMTYAGARGLTEAEMKRALRFELDSPALHEAFNAVDLALASRGRGERGADGTPFRLFVNNAVWMQREFPIVPTFLELLAVNYGAGVFLVDFAGDPERARRAINAWVAQQTEKRVPELLPKESVDVRTRMVLTNSVYFNASWRTKFKVNETIHAPFTKVDGTTVRVPMMNGELGNVQYAKGDLYEAVALPYAGEELVLWAVLPNAGAYEQVEANADVAWFKALRASSESTVVRLAFPRFDHRTSTSLADALEALGMASAFQGADFSGMTETDVELSDVIHEATIKVTESGTIATAATASRVSLASGPPEVERTVRFDRPFLYAIVDQPTEHILFVGRVLDPSAR